ncbi:MAG: ribonuclease HI family protein [Planctomycetes bacterium]|nr:ribonuclease HI family protein [Planctomycetota bacterium]
MSTVKLTINIDGGSRGNPGPAGAGIVIVDQDGQVLGKSGVFIGRATNNVAEYRGLITALQKAKQLGADHVEIVSDSELLVRQMTGVYRVKNAKLIPLFQDAMELRKAFAKCTFRHVPRELNKQADKLANQAMNVQADIDED